MGDPNNQQELLQKLKVFKNNNNIHKETEEKSCETVDNTT